MEPMKCGTLTKNRTAVVRSSMADAKETKIVTQPNIRATITAKRPDPIKVTKNLLRTLLEAVKK